MKPERVLDLSFLSRLQNLSGGGSEDTWIRGRLSASRHAAELYESWHRPVSVSLEMLSCRWIVRSHMVKVSYKFYLVSASELVHSHGPSQARSRNAPSCTRSFGTLCRQLLVPVRFFGFSVFINQAPQVICRPSGATQELGWHALLDTFCSGVGRRTHNRLRLSRG